MEHVGTIDLAYSSRGLLDKFSCICLKPTLLPPGKQGTVPSVRCFPRKKTPDVVINKSCNACFILLTLLLEKKSDLWNLPHISNRIMSGC